MSNISIILKIKTKIGQRHNKNYTWRICLVNYSLNMNCLYPLETPHRGVFNEYPQCMFVENKRNTFEPKISILIRLGFDISSMNSLRTSRLTPPASEQYL